MDMHFEGTIFQTHAAELRRRISRSHPPHLVVDARGGRAFLDGHIPGAVSGNPAELAAGLPAGASPAAELFIVGSDPDDPRTREVALILRRLGAQRLVEYPGGMLEWAQLGYPLESGPRD